MIYKAFFWFESPSNSLECLTSQHQPTTTYFQLSLANPTCSRICLKQLKCQTKEKWFQCFSLCLLFLSFQCRTPRVSLPPSILLTGHKGQIPSLSSIDIQKSMLGSRWLCAFVKITIRKPILQGRADPFYQWVCSLYICLVEIIEGKKFRFTMKLFLLPSQFVQGVDKVCMTAFWHNIHPDVFFLLLFSPCLHLDLVPPPILTTVSNWTRSR